MSLLPVLKAAQLITLAGLAAACFDPKGDRGAARLAGRGSVVAMWACCAAGGCLCAYVVLTLRRALPTDALGLVAMVAGLLMIRKAKSDLGRRHTGAGRGLTDPELVTTGIYAYVRHPLYTGCFLGWVGETLTIVPHSPWPVDVAVLAMALYTLGLFALVARREEKLLADANPGIFKSYRRQVHPLFPIRRFGDQDPEQPHAPRGRTHNQPAGPRDGGGADGGDG